MPRKKLVCTALDDGTTVTVTIHREETVGGVEIGPIKVFEGSVLSFPCGQVEDWQRDMAVLFVERL